MFDKTLDFPKCVWFLLHFFTAIDEENNISYFILLFIFLNQRNNATRFQIDIATIIA